MDKTKLFSAAEKAIAKGQYEKAIEGLESILRADPNDLKALNRAADIYLKTENFDKAVEYLKRVGTVYSKDGFYSKAVAVYKRILKIDQISSKPALIEIHEQLATLYGQLGLVSDAMGHFSIVVDFYDQTGEQEALLQVLKKVSDLDPFNIDSQLKLAGLFLAQNQGEKARETLDQLTENIRARGHLPDVVRVYEQWVQLFPQEIEKLEQLTELYVKAGEPKKALAKIQISFRADPKNPRVLELLSSTFRAMKQPEKGKAVDMELIKIYRGAGEAEKAFAVEERIKSKAPDLSSVEAAQNISSATRKVSSDAIPLESVDAGEALIQSLQLDPEEKKILAECEVYIKYGLTEKAHEVLGSKLGQFPQSLALRWRLKSTAHDLQKNDEVVHILSEIVMLARTKKLEAWEKLAATELGSMDPSHPALAGTVAGSKPVEPEPAKAQAFMEPSLIRDMEPSEISIVVEEESSENSVSDISFDDLESKEINLGEQNPKKPSKQKIEAEPAEKVEKRKSPQTKSSDSDIADELIEISEESGSSEQELLLSESDFTDEELNKLSAQLAPDGKEQKKPAQKSSAEVSSKKASEAKKPAKKMAEEKSSEESMEPIPLELSKEEDGEKSSGKKVPGEEVFDLGNADSNAMELSILSDSSSEVLSDEDFEVRQGLEEVEFFKVQGLKDEAEALLQNLKDKYPNHPEWKKSGAKKAQAPRKAENKKAASKLKEKSVEMETLGAKVKLKVQEDDREEASSSEFYDLAGELSSELSNETKEGPKEIRDVFNAFKKGVAESVSADDWQTHLDLGIAYREMGLIDDAINEFKIVGNTPGQKISSLYQIGVCEMLRENYTVARELFDRALKDPQLPSTQKISVSYELAEALMKLDDPGTAKTLFEEVKKLDPEFREVNEKIEEVTRKLQEAG